MKGSVDIAALQPPGLGFTADSAAGRWPGRAVTGDAVAISAYLGTSDRFDGAIAEFAETYADLNERDHRAYLAAIEAGRVSAPDRATG